MNKQVNSQIEDSTSEASSTTTAVKDWRGTLIEVGDVILYAVKHSTSVEVNEAVVSAVGMKTPSYRGRAYPYVTADWVQSSYSFEAAHGKLFESGRKIKHVVLTNFEGITVIAKGPSAPV